MTYLLKNDIKFLNIKEEKTIPLTSITNIKKIHISSINVGDLIFDEHGNIASVIDVTPEKNCKVVVLSMRNHTDDSIISYR